VPYSDAAALAAAVTIQDPRLIPGSHVWRRSAGAASRSAPAGRVMLTTGHHRYSRRGPFSATARAERLSPGVPGGRALTAVGNPRRLTSRPPTSSPHRASWPWTKRSPTTVPPPLTATRTAVSARLRCPISSDLGRRITGRSARAAVAGRVRGSPRRFGIPRASDCSGLTVAGRRWVWHVGTYVARRRAGLHGFPRGCPSKIRPLKFWPTSA